MHLTIAALLLFSLAGMLFGMIISRISKQCWLLSTLCSTGFAFTAALTVLTGPGAWTWHGGPRIGGESIHLHLDALSAYFLLLTSVIGTAGTLYSLSYWPERQHPRSSRTGRLWWNALLTSMGLILIVSNGLHFLMVWEIFALCAYFLITLERGTPSVRSAGRLYLLASHAGTLTLFLFFSLLATLTNSWNLGPMRDQTALAPLFWLALLGFGIKAGIFPLHIWLPSAHANAPSHVSAVMSGLAIKMGIYGIARFSSWLPLPGEAGWVVAGLGCVSAVLGVAFALGQHDLKRLLAYHSVENIGIILIGLGFGMIALQQGHPRWGMLALSGGLLHIWNHGLFKGLLFLGAGSILHATKTREMSRLGGLWRTMPWTAGLFTLGAVAISALPPLNGFVSEWLIYTGLLQGAQMKTAAAMGAVPAILFLAMTGALALACFAKVCGVVLLGAPRTAPAARARECTTGMRCAMTILAAACLTIGLAPALCWPILQRVAATWLLNDTQISGPNPLVALSTGHLLLSAAIVGAVALAVLLRRRQRRALTWDCGYAAPDARMQYTAGSFAGIITAWFAWILRPTVHAQQPDSFFPREASWTARTPETVLEMLVRPAMRTILRLADIAQRFQHGRTQSYILYLCAALLVLAVVVISDVPHQ